MDKSLYDSYTARDGSRATLNMTGANAKHMGVEVDFNIRPTTWMTINGMFSWVTGVGTDLLPVSTTIMKDRCTIRRQKR